MITKPLTGTIIESRNSLNIGRCTMGMLLRSQSEFFGEYGKVVYHTWIGIKFKTVRDMLLTFSPILWLFFFLILTVLANFVEKVLR